jgi:dipeptidyl aminopeptidase/acylaminoacyl peptidase
LAVSGAAHAMARPLHIFTEIALSPDGAYVAAIEGDQSPAGTVDIKTVTIRPTAGGDPIAVELPCGAAPSCTPSSLAWAPDGRHLGFILRSPGSHAHAIYTAGVLGGPPTRRAAFNGTLVGLQYGANERMAVLATAGAAKEVGAVEAGAPNTGVLGTDVHEQRIASVSPAGKFTFISPPDLFVYEYDWRSGGRGFVGTASHGDGDNNWWVARLYAFDADGTSRLLYTPATPAQQLAQPKVSPDGNEVSFIAGIMSDFGATGGEAYVLPIEGGGTARNITPGLTSTVQSLAWDCERDGKLTASLLAGDRTQIARLSETGNAAPEILYSAQERLGAGDTALTTACGPGTTATIHQSFTIPPEIETGALIGHWHDLTRMNAGLSAPATVRNVTWNRDGFSEQGWLLLPNPAPAGKSLGLITEIHGGPASAVQPRFIGDGYLRRLLHAGYAAFLPNPRGSFGQGEAYTKANVKDFGYGDLQDILAGINAAERIAPIDERKLGVMGWSYGGFMTMWTVTQTNRFRAAVAGAGISDWLSYYGENGIDGWMIPYFGKSVYDDPAIYAKSSPINFIKQVHTPTLEVVGEADIECPAPQTEEFWHALTDLGVPTEAVIYPGEGHAMHDPKHVGDFEDRLVAWFDKYLK